MKTEIRSMNIEKAVEDASRVLMFDQWIRFYYVTEKDGKMYISIPQEQLDKIEENFSQYHSFAELVNNDELTYEKSQATVCAFIGARFDGRKYDPSIMTKVFDSKQFKVEMYVFNLWLKGHESHLDENWLDFSDWMEMYGEWKKMDQVKAYLKKLDKHTPGNLAETSPTVQ